MTMSSRLPVIVLGLGVLAAGLTDLRPSSLASGTRTAPPHS